MKKIRKILLGFLVLIIAYSVFLVLFPLKKDVFYTNEERVEEFIYDKEACPIVLIGSSLSGVFTGQHLFEKHTFNMNLPFAGASTGIEIIKKVNKVPKLLFFETNRIDGGVNTTLVQSIFAEPFYSLKYYLPFLLKKNQFLPNIVDRIKPPQNTTINEQQPPPVLYNALLAQAQKDWWDIPGKTKDDIDKQFLKLEETFDDFSKKGCDIYLYEVPMDSSLYKSPLLTYVRNRFTKLSMDKGYKFIKADTSRSYKTGDGLHLLKGDGDIYIKYFLSNFKRLNQKK